jgi:trehalose 6-phosphate synthase
MSTQEQQVIVLANREPYSHDRDAQGHLTVRRSASGVVNAVEPLLNACAGVWIAHGSASGDRAFATDRDGLAVPPDDPKYRLRRVWLSEEEEREYYDGAANAALWPLCHRAHVQPVFRSSDFETYRTVNARFVDAVCDEATDSSPVVLVQDYHFALAPELIRQRLPASAIAAFWHIPWPHWQTFATCPWRHEILRGLLGSNVLGFQTAADCFNFVESVDRILGVQIDLGEGAICYQGRRVLVRDYAASIEWPGSWATGATVSACRDSVLGDLRLSNDAILGVGVDRLDFTKGIEEKFVVVERLLEMQPELQGRFVFVQLVEPSRRRLSTYRRARLRMLETAERVNRRYATVDYQPIVVVEAHHSAATVARYFRAADVCFVNSLHDGMNLVSKEFVAARDDEQGVLVLSEFAGAANELFDAVIVNPYDIDGSATALAAALTLSRDEQRERMRRMREAVAAHDAHRWASGMLSDVLETCRRPQMEKSRFSVTRVPSWSNA